MPDDIRVLLAEDSATIRRYLGTLINDAPGLRVIGEASDGLEAVAQVATLHPDVVSMDIRMPHLDGLEATRRIMAQTPTPVVVVSGLLEADVALSLQALEAGALAVIGKPPDRKHPAFALKQQQLITTLRAMAGVRVISRRERLQANGHAAQAHKPPTLPRRARPEIVVIGASTGGPSALHNLLRELPAAMPVPVAIVQHMPHEFIGGLVRWLDRATPLQVTIAQHRQILRPGQVVIAPGDAQMRIVRHADGLMVQLEAVPSANPYTPSVDVLFASVAAVCGSAAVGVILTGMGNDGAAGLLAMRTAGAITLAQDESSSTVYGMPGAAVACGAVQRSLILPHIPSAILKTL